MDRYSLALVSALAIVSVLLWGYALIRQHGLDRRVRALEGRPTAPTPTAVAPASSPALDPAAALLRLTGEVRDLHEDLWEEDTGALPRIEALEGDAKRAWAALAGPKYGRQTILPAPVPPSSGRKPRG